VKLKVIVPLAGKGTRLLPLTKRVPKPLVNVAGRPVMDYVMDKVKGLDVEELIVITGHLKDVVEKYIVKHYDVPAKFVEQKTLDGTAGAIDLARPYVDGPVLIIFVDTLFDADLTIVNRTDADGILWAKEVEDYQRFGVIVTDERGYMTRIVEKPSTPISKLANIGLYYIKDWKTLFDGIAAVKQGAPGKGGEYYLTDAFQYMVDRGKKLVVGEYAARDQSPPARARPGAASQVAAQGRGHQGAGLHRRRRATLGVHHRSQRFAGRGQQRHGQHRGKQHSGE